MTASIQFKKYPSKIESKCVIKIKKQSIKDSFAGKGMALWFRLHIKRLALKLAAGLKSNLHLFSECHPPVFTLFSALSTALSSFGVGNSEYTRDISIQVIQCL